MKIKYQGREVEAIEIEIIRANEPWAECQLSDGKVLMFKDVIITVCKLVDEKRPDGNPIYNFQTHRIVRIK